MNTGTAQKLTKTTDVLAVLKAGGRAENDGRLWHLFDPSGTPIDAWQTAIASAVKALREAA